MVQPAALHANLGLLKEALSEAYLALDSYSLLLLGVLVLTGSGDANGWRIPLLLLTGFATMFLADIVWSVGRGTGHLPAAALQDVLYLACYVPIVAAGRAQVRAVTSRSHRAPRGALARSMPYAAMQRRSWCSISIISRGGLGGQATLMIGIVFALTLLLMVRQALVLAWREEHYASLVANASDVIMIIGTDGAVRFASPRSRDLGAEARRTSTARSLARAMGRRRRRATARLSRGDRRERLAGVVGPVELRMEAARPE